MAVAYIASASTNTGLTTSGINTTGASLLVALVADFGRNATTDAVTDSNGNTWQAYSNYAISNTDVAIWYSYNKAGAALVVGASHTATLASGAGFPYFGFAAFSGTATGASSPSDTQNGNGVSATSITLNSVTPSASGELFFTGISLVAGSVSSIDSSFTSISPIARASNMGGGMAYKVGTASAETPTWIITSGNNLAAAIACFKIAASGTIIPTLMANYRRRRIL